MRTLTKTLAAISAATILGLGLTSCTGGEGDGVKRDRQAKEKNFNTLQQKQPAAQMNYSPGREAINRWVKAWDQPGKLSYTYLFDGQGNLMGYYILLGYPMSYCSGITAPYDVRNGSGDTELLLPAPGVDGVFYSGAGCDQKYGFDASTGNIVEWGGNQISYVASQQPLARYGNAVPLGPTAIGQEPR